MSGGNIDYFASRNASIVSISGGTIGTCSAADSSTAIISGGSIKELGVFGFNLPAPNAESPGARNYADSLGVADTSTLNLFGTGFTETLMGGQIYTVIGTLQNGDALNAEYSNCGGMLEFNGVPAAPVPESSTTVSLGLLLMLGLGGMTAAAKRKRSAVQAQQPR